MTERRLEKDEMKKQHAEISKFLSYVLRHKPDSIGLTLDSEGWANIDELILCAAKDSVKLDEELIKAVVDTSDKKRFALSETGMHIRAVQGHSFSLIDINYEDKIPPEILYHGTATRFLDAIREQGLIAGSRQYVHLSDDATTAVTVGQRHGKPVVLRITALAMYNQGLKFHQADNGVWLTKVVPVQFIEG